MKYHISLKFIAVALASLCLLSSLASGIGILALAANDLYENSLEDLHEADMAQQRQELAVNLVHRYASLELAGLPEAYLNSYHGTYWMYEPFQYGHYFYVIRNERGAVVWNTTADIDLDGMKSYQIKVTNLNYRRPVDVLPEENAFLPEPTELLTDEEPQWQETEWAGDEDFASVPPTEIPETEYALEDAETDATEVPSALMSAAFTGPMVYFDSYFDEDGKQVELAYTYAELPPYTVTLYLMDDAAPEEQIWSVLTAVWQYRMQLFYVLGVSLLLFAVFAVYLCCAAGHKPGREEIRAGGLNCIPLDLYLLLAGSGITMLTVLGVAGGEWAARKSPSALFPILCVDGYAICLLFVGFCFACAAQFKTPDKYWGKNLLIYRGGHLAWIILRWLWKAVPKGTVAFFLGVDKLMRTIVRYLDRMLRRVVTTLWRWVKAAIPLVPWVWHQIERAITAVFQFIGRIFRWFWNRIAAFFAMLPLMWQWLLTAFFVIGLLMVTFESRRSLLMVISCCITVALAVYFANSFGVLLDNAKRMAKGDLEAKVDEQKLLGCFRDFAGELNDLADVAMVAAQKQLKSERMKTELITNVSHDIKTPLTSIINYVDLMQMPHSPEEEEMYLEVLSRQSQRMKKLIEDLMEMSKASTGNMSVDMVDIDAGEAVSQALGEFSDKLTAAELTPVLRKPDVPLYMRADGRLSWRVMSNLLSNAVKYAQPGTRLYIDVTELEGKVIISVKNVSREQLNVDAEELLERFVRGDTSRNTEGSGLGLNIAKSLMELQGGSLQLLVDGDLFKVTLVFAAC